MAASDGRIGLAAPMSNYAPPPLLVERVPFRLQGRDQLAALGLFA
jgi:hypothetical protein